MADADGDEEPWKSIGEPAATVPGNEAQPRPGREGKWSGGESRPRAMPLPAAPFTRRDS